MFFVLFCNMICLELTWFYCVELSMPESFLYTNLGHFVVLRFCTRYKIKMNASRSYGALIGH